MWARLRPAHWPPPIDQPASPPAPPPPSPPKPAVEEIAATCKAIEHNPVDAKNDLRRYLIDCPLTAPFISSDIVPGALRRAGVLGAFLEAEELVAVRTTDSPAASLQLLVVYAPPRKFGFFDPAEVAEGAFLLRTADVLPPELYDGIKEKVEIDNENRIYSQCKALVLDIEAATKEPARAAACSNTMAVVDRNREVRRRKFEADREHQRRVSESIAQRQVIEEMRAQQGAHEREMANIERRRNLSDALRQLGEMYKPKASSETECQETFGYGHPVRCTTTQK